jgi:hypothetical protein
MRRRSQSGKLGLKLLKLASDEKLLKALSIKGF